MSQGRVLALNWISTVTRIQIAKGQSMSTLSLSWLNAELKNAEKRTPTSEKESQPTCAFLHLQPAQHPSRTVEEMQSLLPGLAADGVAVPEGALCCVSFTLLQVGQDATAAAPKPRRQHASVNLQGTQSAVDCVSSCKFNEATKAPPGEEHLLAIKAAVDTGALVVKVIGRHPWTDTSCLERTKGQPAGEANIVVFGRVSKSAQSATWDPKENSEIVLTAAKSTERLPSCSGRRWSGPPSPKDNDCFRNPSAVSVAMA